MQNSLTRVFGRLLAGLSALAAAGGTAMVLARALGLFRQNESYTMPGGFEYSRTTIIDEGMIALFVSLAAGPLAASLAAKDAGIGRSTVLGLLAGTIVAAIVSFVSKVGISQGTPLVVAAIAAAVVVGFGLRLGLNRVPAQVPRA
jgi:hypothetical protein